MGLRIGIAGITGRMGRLVEEEARKAGAEISGGTRRADSSAADDQASLPGIEALAATAQVVIDFTHASAVQTHAAALAAAGTAWVLGTSGLSAEDERAAIAASKRIPVVYAANFASGVSLVLSLAERMGAALPAEAYDAEIVEMHHRQKLDAPSGTAIAIGKAVATGRAIRLEDAIISGRHGQSGPRPQGAIGFAALRGGQIVGEHTLIFTAADEQIVLTHRAFDRRSFAAGAVRAAFWVAGRPPGLYGMADVLGIADRSRIA